MHVQSNVTMENVIAGGSSLQEKTAPATGANRLLNAMMEKLGVNSDRKLASALEVHAATVSRIRHKKIEVPASLVISMHEKTGMPIRAIKDMLGSEGTPPQQ